MRGYDKSRRQFLANAALGTGTWAGAALATPLLRPVLAEDSTINGDVVRFTGEIEPLVRLLEETPREKVLEAVVGRIHAGESYRDLVAALFLAGVRNVQPRPSVGFKFHAVLVVNSAHLASLASPAADRWLPILWAIDNFKASQERDIHEGNWTMSSVDESAVPVPSRCEHELRTALDRWDVERADAAVTGFVRSAGATEVLALFSRYGMRDFRSIGHKAIYVANAWRTLQCIGWQHAEPIVRSLAYALLNHEGEPNPSESDLAADRPYRENLSLVSEIRADWLDGQRDIAASHEIVTALRSANAAEAAKLVVALLNRGVAPSSIFDGLFLSSGELLMRQTGIVALHAVTTTNAMHYLYRAASDAETRKLLLLQNAAFLALFREAAVGRGPLEDQRIDELRGADRFVLDGDSVSRIFTELGASKIGASAQAMAYLEHGGDAQELMRMARQLIFLKGNDSHDYKFSSAVLEDFYALAPTARNAFLSAAIVNLRSTAEKDTELSQRIRAASV